MRKNSAEFVCLPEKCVYKEKMAVFLQLYRTFLNSSTLFYFQTKEYSETDCSLCRTQEAANAIQGKFLHISTSNMITNVSTSPEGFGVGRQLL